MTVLLGDVVARRVPVSAFGRYHVSLQRKKCCQQIIGPDDEPFSLVLCSRPFLCRLSGPEVRLSEPEVAFFGRAWGFRFARRKRGRRRRL